MRAVLLETDDEDETRDDNQPSPDSEQPTGNACGDSDQCGEEGSVHRTSSVEPGAIVTEMLRIVTAAALMLLLIGCTPPVEGPSVTTTTTIAGAETPDGALRDLLSAVATGDVASAAKATDESQVALLIALDSATLTEAVAMLEDGVPESSAAAFWASFDHTYGRSAGEDLGDMLVATGQHVTVDGVEFVTVEVALRKTSGATSWLSRKGEDGRWRVDLFATFAPIVAQPMRLWLTTLPDEPDVGVVRRALAMQRPSLLASLQQQPLGPISPGVAEQIRGLLVDVGATG